MAETILPPCDHGPGHLCLECEGPVTPPLAFPVGWIAFSDQRPEPQYDPKREGPSHPDILVTNNLAARNRWGQMSHLWLVSMVHYHDEGPYEFGGRVRAEKGEITAFAQPSDMEIRGLTHWRPAVPEEWPVEALDTQCEGCGAWVAPDPSTPEGRGHQVPNGDGSPGYCGPVSRRPARTPVQEVDRGA